MEFCVFCEIVKGSISSTKVYEDDYVCCFKDVNPQARVHVLIVPKKHVANMAEALESEGLMEKLCCAARKCAELTGVNTSGYRLIMNTGDDARQSVHHLHMHLLGGQELSESMA